MLIDFPKNIGKSRDKSYPTDQKTSSILVPTEAKSAKNHFQQNRYSLFDSHVMATANLAEKWQQRRDVKVKVRDSGCKHTLFRPFSIVGPLQFSITND